jgi:localization factor PodJL
MKFGFPWRVKGIRQEARLTAQEAARRAGMPLNDWLNTIIMQQAATQGIRPPSLARRIDEAAPEHLTDVHHRIDNLARRIDQVTNRGAAAYAPKRGRDDSDQFADLTRLEQRVDQFDGNLAHPSGSQTVECPPSLANAIAEFAARRRLLNGETGPAQPHHPVQYAPPPAPIFAQDLSGLESQLQRITEQIETLRRPGAEEAIAAFRLELREIGRTLDEAMPRLAIETIETQIQTLTERIADGRQAGADGNALAGVEHGLSEVRDALRALTPAENLVGYNEAIDVLTHKIDVIVAQRDPATMEQFENSISTLREMAAHVASNETVSGLSAQVQALADKIDHLAIGGDRDALNRLELRIDALSRALADQAQTGDAMPPRLEALMASLSAKIEQLQQSHGGQIAIDHLEDRIAKLFERLDATDSRLNHLDAIERGLTDLLVHIEDIRADKETAELRTESAPGVDLLKQDMTRTHDALAAVNGTLDRVAERLAVIEKDIRDDRQKPAATEHKPTGTVYGHAAADLEIFELAQPHSNETADAPVVDLSEKIRVPITAGPEMLASISAALKPATAPGLAPESVPMRPATHAPAPSSPPSDQPLEPGSGRPGPVTSPSMRIAASEAALGGVRPNMTTAGGKSDFIAAARRAAQAAGQDPKGRHARTEPLKTKDNEPGSAQTTVMTRVKTLFLAASVVAIIVGSIQFASNIFDFQLFDTHEAKFAVGSETDAANNVMTAETTESETSTALAESQPAPPKAPNETDLIASLLAPPNLPNLAPAASPPPAPAVQAPLDLNPAGQVSSTSNLATNPPTVSPSLPAVVPPPKADVTGSIPRTPADPRTSRPAQAAQPPATDELPAAIGGARLRNAASAGDPTAAYEIAMRFMEGRGVQANLAEAARWYERAASKGLTPAQFRYASMLEKGQGVKKDLVAAQKLYIAAASKGHAKAMHNLAVLYAEGAEGKPDYASAALWFRKAAEHGVADSQFNFGVLAARGLGTEKDIAESYKWFALAAAQGDRDAGRKRDEVAVYLNPEALAAAQEAIKSFTPQPQPVEATMVQQPPGGWERAASPAQEKPRASGPLSVSSFNSGKL